MKKWFTISVLILLVSSSIQVSAENDPVLARIGDKTVKLSDFKRLTAYYDADKQKALEQNPQHKEKLLKLFVEVEVLSALAREKALDKRADIVEQIMMLTKNFLANAYIKNEIIDKIHVTESAVRAYYKTHQEEFKNPELLRARHIFIRIDLNNAADEDKDKAKLKIDGLMKRIKSGEDFAKLAGEFSDDPDSKTKGGDLGFFQRGRMSPEFDKVAFSLKPGEFSDVVETPFGYHIIRVEEKKDASIESFDKVRDKIEQIVFADLKKQRVEDFFSQVFKDAGVEFYPEAFYPKK